MVYRPPFTHSRQSVGQKRQNPGYPSNPNSIECPVVSRAGQNRPAQKPMIHLTDPDKIRMQEERSNRRTETVTQNGVDMASDGESINPKFFDDEAKNAKTVKVWVFPEECKGTHISRRSGVSYDGVLNIGVNGKMFPLLPGNNEVPEYVYDALMDWREMSGRFKRKLNPSHSERRVHMGGSAGIRGVNKELFEDSMLPKPNYFDPSVNAKVNNIIRHEREKALSEKRIITVKQ